MKRKNDKKKLSNKAKKKQLAEAKVRREMEPVAAPIAPEIRAVQLLQEHRQLTRNVRRTIEELFNSGDKNFIRKMFVLGNGTLSCAADLCTNITHPGPRAAAKRLILFLEDRKSRILDCRDSLVEHTNALHQLSLFHYKWIRQPEDWIPDSKNPRKQFASLLRHLLAKYPVPLFMDTIWFVATATNRQRWWLHIADGENIRTAKDLPIPLTKKMAHFMMQAPKDLSIDAAFRWGQIHALGGNERNVRGLLGTFLCQGYFEHDEFWQSVFRFFIQHPMLDTARYGPICDYIRNQKFITPLGATQPPQPNFTMKYREPAALLTQVEAWHTQLTKASGTHRWDHHKIIEDFFYEEGKDEKHRVYRIIELLTSKDLRDEGKRLNHCVFSYDRSCAAGRTGIWSVRKDLGSGLWEPMGTIELRNCDRMIVQFRAKWNEQPEQKAYALMRRWAAKWNLTIPNYL